MDEYNLKIRKELKEYRDRREPDLEAARKHLSIKHVFCWDEPDEIEADKRRRMDLYYRYQKQFDEEFAQAKHRIRLAAMIEFREWHDQYVEQRAMRFHDERTWMWFLMEGH